MIAVRWVSRLFSALVRFWSAPIRPEPLALFRIALGINLLLNLCLTILPYLNLLAGADGLTPAEAVDPFLKRSGRFCLLRGPVNIPFLQSATDADAAGKGLPPEWSRAWADWGATPQGVWTLMSIYLVAIVFFTVGFWTRLATIVCWALTVTFHNRLVWSMNGGDAVVRMALFYLLFARCGAVWSVDHAWRRWRNPQTEPAPLIPPWPVRLMQIQLCFVYLFTGLIKLGNTIFTSEWYTSDWIDGEAVYWVLNDMALNRWPYYWTPFPLWICRCLTWMTMVLELGFPIFVLFRVTRPWCLLVGLFLHLGIWLHLEIAWFSQFMLCWYILFLSPDTLTWFVRAVGRLWPFRSGSGVVPTGPVLSAIPVGGE